MFIAWVLIIRILSFIRPLICWWLYVKFKKSANKDESASPCKGADEVLSTLSTCKEVVSRVMRKFVLQTLSKWGQPAKEASFWDASKCFMFIYFLFPHCVPATCRSRAQTSIKAEFPSGKHPTTLVRRRISRFSRSMTLFVRILDQCSEGKSQ